MLACSLELFGTLSIARSAIQVKAPVDVGLNYLPVVCAACEDPSCASACESGALKPRPEGGVELVAPRECEKCETYDCTKACIVGALRIDPVKKIPIVCTECGECAKYCPHEVLVYGEVAR